MSGILQNFAYGRSFAEPAPTTIGQAFGGGYYAGKISTAGNGVADYYLVVAPKSTGQTTGQQWGPRGTDTGVVSVINGPANTATLVALGSTYASATWCDNLTIGGYTDWYLPAQNELEVLYYFLKPSTDLNEPSSGANSNAVSPEPFNTNYTTTAPPQTSATSFRVGNSQAFGSATYDVRLYYSSTQQNINSAWCQQFDTGYQSDQSKEIDTNNQITRAVRRVPV